MATDTCCHSQSLNLVLIENAVDNVGYIIQLHDLTIDDGVGLKILKAQVHQLKAVPLLLQLHSFYGAGADVEADEIFFARAFLKHVYLFLTAKRERILCCCRRRARAFIALETRLLAVFVELTGLSIFKTGSLGGRLMWKGHDSEAGRAFACAQFKNHWFAWNLAFLKIEGCWNEDEENGKSLIGQHSSLLSSSRLQYRLNNVNHYFARFNSMSYSVLRGTLSSEV